MSEDIEKPSTATPSSTGSKSDSTKITGSGTILLVAEPLDLGYQCLIMQAAKKILLLQKMVPLDISAKLHAGYERNVN